MTDAADGKLGQILRATLELPPDVDVTRVRQLGVATWDSLAHVTLIVALESEFGIAIDVADQIRLTSYAAIRSYLEERGVGVARD